MLTVEENSKPVLTLPQGFHSLGPVTLRGQRGISVRFATAQMFVCKVVLAAARVIESAGRTRGIRGTCDEEG